MPSKNKPSIWQKLSHAPSRSYADAAPAHPSRPGRGPSPYSAPSTSLTSGALAAAEKAHRYQQRQAGVDESRDYSAVSSYVGTASRAASAAASSSREHQPQPQQQQTRRSAGPRKQTLQYNEAESRFMMMDDPDDDGAEDASDAGGGGSTQWRHPSLRKEGSGARSDIGPTSAAAPAKKKRSSRRLVEQDGDSSAGRIHTSQADRRRGSASDVQPLPAATVIEHHHHYYGPPPPTLAGAQNGPLPAGPTSAVYTSSPSSSQLGSTSQLGAYDADPRRRSA
jgi:hypothetical protein